MTLRRPGGGERGRRRYACNAGERDGRGLERRDGGNAIRRAEGRGAEAHIPPERLKVTIGNLLKVKARSRARLSWATACQRKRPAGVVVRAPSPNPEVERPNPLVARRAIQRRPCPGVDAAAVHEDERRAIARFEDPHGYRRVRETHAPARDLLHPARR